MKESKFINNEEQEFIESLERDEWEPLEDIESWKNLLSKTATNTLTKDQRMNIRLTKNDLDGIKLKAIEEGIPYQTLIASIIHKYVTGKLCERVSESI